MITETEQQMREQDVPWIKSEAELTAYIDQLVARDHDYGTCVYAMSMAAVAAYQYVAGRLGVTGFQASCADMDILRRTRGLEAGLLIDFSNALYPQYDLHAKLDESLANSRQWLADKARGFLESERDASPAVVEHWRRIAARGDK